MNEKFSITPGSQVHTGSYYLEFLSTLNRELQPQSYFEIGTDNGFSLNCFTCDVLCIDPNFQITSHVWQKRRRTMLIQSTSDEFFADKGIRQYFPNGPDIAFLDGMHRAEYLLRDLINVEKESHSRTLVLMHDCLPLSTRMAERDPRPGDPSEGNYQFAWTGDVWRVLFALKKYRPDLRVSYLDCPPTGLVAIAGLTGGPNVLSDSYEAVIADMMALELTPERLTELWNLYPILDTRALAATPSYISAVLNCH